MPIVEFAASHVGPEMRVDVPDGGPLVDLCDDARAPVPFSCRSASCGTCRIEVLLGADLLEPPSEAEAEVLAIFGDPPSRRLACSATLRRASGLLRLRVVDDT